VFDRTNVCADVAIVSHDDAIVEVSPKRKKVAIVGFASNTLHLVPWNDPSFEIWGMNQGYLHMHRKADRWFEMHSVEATADVRDPNYLEWLNQIDIPVYMIERRVEVPYSVRYPIERAIKYAGRDYFMSSVAFMLAVAGLEGFEEIHLYGINLAIKDEYFYEKPNAEWWLGFLEAKGIRVYVPSASSLLKQQKRYGYSIDARPNQNLKVLVESRIAQYRSQAEQHAGALNTTLGAMREDEALLQILEGVDHGADIVLIPVSQAPQTS
jgi:hypothetical protein